MDAVLVLPREIIEKDPSPKVPNWDIVESPFKRPYRLLMGFFNLLVATMGRELPPLGRDLARDRGARSRRAWRAR